MVRERSESLVGRAPEKRNIDAQIEELEKEKRVLLREIAKLEAAEWKRKEEGERQPPIFSRRKFLKGAAIAAGTVVGGVAGAGLLKTKLSPGEGDEIEEKTGELPPQEKLPPDWTIENNIEECERIIKEERYEEILKNPYLVSALFYSGEYVEEIPAFQPSPKMLQTNPEKIIKKIYPLITKKFRENFISVLKETIRKEGGQKSETANSGRESPPLDSLHIGASLEKNHPNAIDLFIEEGSPVYSMSGGIVVLAENGWKEDDDLSTSSARGGNTVIVFNPRDETFYRYAHLEKTVVAPGTVLGSGSVIGAVGHSGVNASKPGHGKHVHFEINRYDRASGKMAPINVLELARKLKGVKK